jgi:hypothetical protein
VSLVDADTGEIVSRSLHQCEAVIGRGLDTFFEVGEALKEIRDRRLYQLEFATFESYCRERWDMSRAYSDRLITAAEVVDLLTPIGVIDPPMSEAQARALAPLKDKPEEMAEVLHQVQDEAAETGCRVTAEKITEKVTERVEGQPSRKRTLVERQNLLTRYEEIKNDPARCQEMADSEAFSSVKALRMFCSTTRKLLAEGDQRTKLSEAERVVQITAAASEGLSSRQIADRLGLGFEQVRAISKRNQIEVPADAVVGNTRRIDSNRIANETVTTLEGVAMSLRLVDPADLDATECEEWVISLGESLKVLTRFRNQLKEMTS